MEGKFVDFFRIEQETEPIGAGDKLTLPLIQTTPIEVILQISSRLLGYALPGCEESSLLPPLNSVINYPLKHVTPRPGLLPPLTSVGNGATFRNLVILHQTTIHPLSLDGLILNSRWSV